MLRRKANSLRHMGLYGYFPAARFARLQRTNSMLGTIADGVLFGYVQIPNTVFSIHLPLIIVSNRESPAKRYPRYKVRTARLGRDKGSYHKMK